MEVPLVRRADRAGCPWWGRVSPPQQDRRLLVKRRCRCLTWRCRFTEADPSAAGDAAPPSACVRPGILPACSRPLAQVAAEREVGPRLGQRGLETVAQARLNQQGRSGERNAPLATPRFLGPRIADCVQRNGQRYATRLGELEACCVLEVVPRRRSGTKR